MELMTDPARALASSLEEIDLVRIADPDGYSTDRIVLAQGLLGKAMVLSGFEIGTETMGPLKLHRFAGTVASIGWVDPVPANRAYHSDRRPIPTIGSPPRIVFTDGTVAVLHVAVTH